MRIARFEHEGRPHTGVVLGEEIAVMDDQPLPPQIERIRTLIESLTCETRP